MAERFSAMGMWPAAGRCGAASLDGNQSVAISVPAQLGGTERATKPEQLLLASALSCYTMGLGRLCSHAGPADHLTSVAIAVSRTLDRIPLRSRFGTRATGPERKRLLRLAPRAEATCVIARTLRPVIPYELDVVSSESTEGA